MKVNLLYRQHLHIKEDLHVVSGKDGSVWVSDKVPGSSLDLGFESDSIRREHKEKDFISLLSCTPG